MIAEGGTEYAHRETIQRSASVWGPYTPCPHNPIISHKEYKKSEIQATGHADLVEDANGSWWLVFLGIRRFSHALLHNLGRETFLAPVTWKDGWPVVGYNGNGTIELVMDAPLPGLEDEESKKNIHIDSKSGKPMLYSDHSVHIDFLMISWIRDYSLQEIRICHIIFMIVLTQDLHSREQIFHLMNQESHQQYYHSNNQSLQQH